MIHLASKLRIQLTSADSTTPMNAPSFTAGEFVDNKDGSYTTYYVAKNTGLYRICIQFEDAQLKPCPFEVHVVQGNISVGQMRFIVKFKKKIIEKFEHQYFCLIVK